MLKVVPYQEAIPELKTPLLVVPVFEDNITLPSVLQFLVNDMTPVPAESLSASRFEGKLEDYRLLYTKNQNIPLLAVLGAGKLNEWDMEKARQFFGQSVKIAQKLKIPEFAVYWDDQFPVPKSPDIFFTEIVAACCMANFKMMDFQTETEEEKKFIPVDLIKLVTSGFEGEIESYLEAGQKLGQSVNYARWLAELPPNQLTPDRFVEEIRKHGENYGWKLDILDKERLEKEGLNALLAVAQGSSHPPYLAIIQYQHPEAARTISLIGKGVTFDSGGISLKPSKNMEEMKYDMSGAAVTLATVVLASELKLPINIVAAIPLVENLPSGKASRPGDIVKSYDGTTIEILNTDAEGRLILADAIAYTVKNYKPEIVVDLATLTGAVIVALGHAAAGLISNDNELIAGLEAAGNVSGERVWNLPAWTEYGELMKSDIADLRNISKKSGAGTITAAMFLKHFVKDTRWAHLDIAGTAWDMPEKSYRGKGPSGFGVRLLYHWIKSIIYQGE